MCVLKIIQSYKLMEGLLFEALNLLVDNEEEGVCQKNYRVLAQLHRIKSPPNLAEELGFQPTSDGETIR